MSGTCKRIMLCPVFDELNQVERLFCFQDAHPNVIIEPDHRRVWHGRIPETNGEIVAVRYTLRELLDRLDELTDG